MSYGECPKCGHKNHGKEACPICVAGTKSLGGIWECNTPSE